MEIVKKLSLNKTPKDIPNGSIVCAKNMMVDDTGSFLTNDIGFKEAVTFNGENIVGVIPCSSEIVILTVDGSNNSHIYRKSDFSDKIDEVLNTWTYHGGKITGTYTYNYKNELILVIAESGATEDVPLKSFIIHTNHGSDNEQYPYIAEINQTYAVEEDIPIYDSSYKITTEGQLVCGVYTFFVRFLIDEYNFTKWFQITTDINIIHKVLSKEYVHNYVYKKDKFQVYHEKVNVNGNDISDKRITVNFGINSNTVYSKFQLGYIIKRNADVQGRIQGTYSIKDFVNIPVSDNTYIEEIGIDELLENPHQFFNVENAINYNNRLYLTNYKEHDIIDLTNKAQVDITVAHDISIESEAPPQNTYRLWTINLNISQKDSTSNWKTNEKVVISNIKTDLNGVVSNPQNLIDKLARHLSIKLSKYNNAFDFNSSMNSSGGRILNKYWFIQNGTNNSTPICIAKHVNLDVFDGEEEDVVLDPPQDWDWNFTIPDYAITIQSNEIVLSVNGEDYNLLDEALRSCILTIEYSITLFDEVIPHHYFGNGLEINPNDFRQNITPLRDDIQFVSEGMIAEPGEGEYNPDDDDSQEGSGNLIGSTGSPNNRTLHPHQKYNFFIHYIRKDGSVTPGYSISNVTSFAVSEEGNLIIPTFSVIVDDYVKNNFIGYFISYEDVEETVQEVYITAVDVDEGTTLYTNAEYLYDINTIRGILIKVDGVDYYINDKIIEYISNRLNYNRVRINDLVLTALKLGYVIRKADNLYKNEYKTLYRLTKNIYDWDVEVTDKDYLPAYYNNQLLITYRDTVAQKEDIGLILQPNITSVLSINLLDSEKTGAETKYQVDFKIVPLYCKYPTSAMNIKEDYVYGGIVLDYEVPGNNQEGKEKVNNLFANCLVTPDRLHDYLELQPAYQAKPSKSYTNYRKDNISRFDKTVYRSDVISDESLVNGFRHFDPNNYKNILENKGKITNIVGIGFYFIVHTEYSMFVFDRSPKLTKTRQLEIPDTFDIDYQEVMPSNEGFGGLRHKEESILTKNGYIWYDRANNIIFKYENGESQILSVDINNFLKQLDITKIRFAEDITHNRIFICITVEGGKYITLSYSFYTNTFLSLHDFKFTNNYRTYNKSYIFNNEAGTKSVLYEFDNEAISDYKALTLKESDNFVFPTFAFNETKNKSYVDIIFNETYEVVKVLNSIHYVLNEIKSKFDSIIVSEENLERRFSGDEMRIYTDETNTLDFNINIEKDKVNAVELYDLPAFEKGKWNLNYFRDVVNNVGFQANESESDNRRLIYGKYIVVRFIFHNDRKVKLDNVDVDIQLY